ncbi:MAG: hypothetical protein K9N34_02530 [Candidatus Marinimicrobia bacterium]|nr:hypothetical protein [Candidatus Neomarinimicrobiota bacterium]MCF7839644.1 hypothetical protein [Candidatus Neomarinimicrobiota bacterium]MCF7902532.1 hypothetical protein [Candidatus Neomarinimicrobiota bacterium]
MKSRNTIISSLLILWISVTPLLSEDFSWYFETAMLQNDHYLGSSISDNQQSLGVEGGVNLYPSEQVRLSAFFSGEQVYPTTDYSRGALNFTYDWRSLTDDASAWKHYGGISAGLYRYAADLSYNDYFNLNGYFRTKFNTSMTSFWEGRYLLNAKFFQELPEASNLQHWLDLKYHCSFPTRTAMTINLGAGVQDFLSASQSTTIGRGRRQVIVAALPDLPTNYMGTTNLRLSQSVTSWMGAYYDFYYQKRLDDHTDGVIVSESETSPIMDDFRWSGFEHSTGLNFRLPMSISLSVDGSVGDRLYNDVPVYQYDFSAGDYTTDADGNYIISAPQRTIESQRLQVVFTKTFYPGTYDDMGALDFWIQGQYLNLDGNDPLYQYAGKLFQTGITFNY